MAVSRMQRMHIFAMCERRDEILERLQERGVLEIDIPDTDHGLQTLDTQTQRQTCERNAQLLQQAIGVLARYASEKKSLLASLAGKPLIEKQDYRAVCAQSDALLESAQRALALEKEIAEHHAAIIRLENQIISLQPWLALDIPMDFGGTRETAFFPGTIPGWRTVDDILADFAAADGEAPLPDLTILSQSKDYTYLGVVCHREDARQTEDILRGIGFARPSQLCSEPPTAAQARCTKEIRAAEDAIANTEQQLGELSAVQHDLETLFDHYRMEAERYAALAKLPHSRETFFVSGYVPASCAKKLADELTSRFEAVVELEDAGDDAPVLLKNNGFGSMAEGITKSFGLPSKGEIDPSFLTACFFVFFFGLMLSDAAYGFMLALGCGFALIKFPRMDAGMRKSLQLFFWGGLSTLFWGIMLGGYFGDAVNVISRVFFGREVSIPALWFAPLDDPTKLLIYSMLFGLIHLFTGLGVKGYMCLKNKDIVGFIFDVLCWFFLLIGLIIMLLPTDLFYGISQMKFDFPAAVVSGGKYLAIAGAVGLILMAARSNKNPVLRIALGAYELYNITGWLSDVLSYSRLLALGLATGVIAQVVNQMGSMF
ncbi:MAG: V-type ATP synthase subunit I, partial [Oscillospiraceae bacterium]|nr:V-type ATP synthase subunit I [Oscillospiraceae bacterium]